MDSPGLSPTTAELVLLNGRTSGAKRKLTAEVSLIGSAAHCEIRLTEAGVVGQHCLLALTMQGLVLRDLSGGMSATFVNGQKVQQALLRDGDVLAIGPYQFRVHCPMAPAEALRAQVAAVAAQQAALDEMEARAQERRAALARQEDELASSVDEKRRELLLLAQRVETEKAVFEQERQARERQLAELSGGLGQAQREVLVAREKLQDDRQRLAGLYHRIKRRWHQHWKLRQQQLIKQRRELEHRIQTLAKREEGCRQAEAALHERRLRLNSEMLTGRHELQEAWHELRRARFRWRQRRGKERALLRVRRQELEAAATQLAQVRKQLQRQQAGWLRQRQALETELDGLNQRIANQRELLVNVQAEPAPNTPALAVSATSEVQLFSAVPPTVAVEPPCPVEDYQALTAALEDQRLLVVEAWQRVGELHAAWHQERATLAAELEVLAQHFFQRDLELQAREQCVVQGEHALRERHEALVRFHRQVVAWRARLRADEEAWEHDKGRLLNTLRHKEALAEKHAAALVDLRRRWLRRRKHEVQQLQSERQTLDAVRKEFARIRQEVTERAAKLQDEKRILVERALALEQHQRELILKSGDAAQAEHRLERFRRRWITQNAEAIREWQRQRDALQTELGTIDQRFEMIQQRSAAVEAAEATLLEKRIAWEKQELAAETRLAKLQHDLQQAETQRLLTEQQCLALRDEVERIARALLEEPDPPHEKPLAA